MLNLLIHCISARSAVQVLPVKDECLFHFSNVLLTGLCNSSGNTWFGIITLLMARPKDSLSKNHKPQKQDLFYIHNISDLAILIALSSNIIYNLRGKSLKSP